MTWGLRIICAAAAWLVLSAPAGAQDVQGYAYDALGRLVASTRAESTGVSSYSRYVQDDADNLIREWTEQIQPLTAPDRLLPGETIIRGQALVAGTAAFRMQHDGNAVLYCGATPIWSTSSASGEAVALLMDGSGTLYLFANALVWTSGTYSLGARLVLEPTGLLVIYNTANQAIWSRGPC